MAKAMESPRPQSQPLRLESAGEIFDAVLQLPESEPWGAVIFGGAWWPHSSFAASMLSEVLESGLAVLAIHLQDHAESQLCHLRAASLWLEGQPFSSGLAQGLFGTGALAAPVLRMAAEPPASLRAVMIYEGSADMSEADLEGVQVPSLFVAESSDPFDAELHEAVSQMLHCESRLILLEKSLIPPKAAVEWFVDHFKSFYRGDRPVKIRGDRFDLEDDRLSSLPARMP